MLSQMLKRTKGKSKSLSPSKLLKQILNSCADAKGREIVALDVSRTFSIASYFVIVSGRSDRQVQGICNRVINDLAEQGYKPYSVDGIEDGHWALLDCEDVVVHVFYEPLREHYNLEGLWTAARKLSVEKYLEHQEAA